MSSSSTLLLMNDQIVINDRDYDKYQDDAVNNITEMMNHVNRYNKNLKKYFNIDISYK